MSRNLAFGALALAALPLLSSCVVATSTNGSNGGGGGGGLFLLFVPIIVIFATIRLARGRRTRRSVEPSAKSLPTMQMLRAELSVLADDVLRLEPQVALTEAARDDYESATHRYRVAQAALDEGGDKVDLVRVQRVVDEAAWSMTRARAIIDGREPPPPPATLQQPGSRGEPAVRLDDGAQPTYVGSPAPFRSGWFGMGAGLFGGLLFGPMLGGFGVWGDEVQSDGETFEEGPGGSAAQ
jgi:hypothetical protein